MQHAATETLPDLAFSWWSFPDLVRMDFQYLKAIWWERKKKMDCAHHTIQRDVQTATAGTANLLIIRQLSPPLFPFQKNRTQAQKKGRRGFDYLRWVTIQTQRYHWANWVRGAGTVTADTSWSKRGTVWFSSPPRAPINKTYWCMDSQWIMIYWSVARHLNMNGEKVNQKLDQSYVL